MKESILYLEKRGCNFMPGDKTTAFSDIGNYRVSTPGYTVRGKDGRQYFLEFTRDYRYRRALFMDICYQDKDGVTRSNLDIKFNEFRNEKHPFTVSGILQAVNIFAAVKYTAIEFIN